MPPDRRGTSFAPQIHESKRPRVHSGRGTRDTRDSLIDTLPDATRDEGGPVFLVPDRRAWLVEERGPMEVVAP